MTTVVVEEGIAGLDARDVAEAKKLMLEPLPAARSGAIEVKHLSKSKVEFYDEIIDYPHTFDVMVEHPKGGYRVKNGHESLVWMSATPQEIVDLLPLVRRFESGGRIFMSGLGLGLLPRLLDHYGKTASRFLVVEQSSNVIELVWPHVARAGYDVKHGDVNDVMSTVVEQFDLVVLDTWPAGDYIFLPLVESLAKEARRIQAAGGETWLWQYDNMLQRLENELNMIADMLQPGILDNPLVAAGLRAKWPFFEPYMMWLNKRRRTEAQVSKRVQQEIHAFRHGKREGLYSNTMTEDLTVAR